MNIYQFWRPPYTKNEPNLTPLWKKTAKIRPLDKMAKIDRPPYTKKQNLTPLQKWQNLTHYKFFTPLLYKEIGIFWVPLYNKMAFSRPPYTKRLHFWDQPIQKMAF